MTEVRAKICGICSADDARAAAAAGADYVGVILAPGHRRTRSPDDAAAIYDAVAVRRVGVFVDPSPAEVRTAAVRHRLHAVQLHGEETAALVPELRTALRDAGVQPLIWKAVRVRTPDEVDACLDEWAACADAVLLDGWSPAARGGAGIPFAWRAVAGALRGRPRTCPLIVAGGLTPGNVAGVIRILSPDVVDVSSGVEEEIGRKSAELMRAFIVATRTAAPEPTAEA